MEKYLKKIKVNLGIVGLLDPNDSGTTVTYVNTDDLFIPFILKQNIKDLGVYTDYKEKAEIIDLGNFWNISNNGVNDGGQNPISDGVSNPYGNNDGGDTLYYGDGNYTIYGCTDPNALNYNPNATVDDGSCDNGAINLGTSDNTTNVDQPQNLGGGLFKLSSGDVSDPGSLSDSYLIDLANKWCRAIHPSCGGAYPILTNCTPNGCPTTTQTCCPGPQNTYRLFVSSDCTGQVNCGNYSVNYNNAQSILCNSNNPPFPNIIRTTSDPNNNDDYNVVWYFYCIQI
jgi:hypothetical protein